MSEALELVCSRLGDVHPKSHGGYTARCPAHEEDHHSLSIDAGNDGRVLLKCFAGCDNEVIVKALGLTMSDLFPRWNGRGGVDFSHLQIGSNTRTPHKKSNKPKKVDTVREDRTVEVFESNGSNSTPPGVTLKAYADAKRIPLKTLLTYGVRDLTLMGTPAVRIPYRDRDGHEPAVRLRMALDGDNKFRWKTGSKPFLYGLWRLHEGPALTLVEGESDCHTLWETSVRGVKY